MPSLLYRVARRPQLVAPPIGLLFHFATPRPGAPDRHCIIITGPPMQHERDDAMPRVSIATMPMKSRFTRDAGHD